MSSSQGPAPQTSLANRYGRQKRALTRKQKTLWLVGALVVAIIIAGIFAFVQPGSRVEFKTVGFSANDPSFTEVDFQVSKAPGDSAVCAVQALDSSYAVVGFQYVDVPPNDVNFGQESGRTTQHRTILRTESLAVTGTVDSCWIVSK